MSCNLQLLLHLPGVVRRFGPLWVTSCFLFENMNGILKRLVHGTKYAELRISSSISLFLNHDALKEKYLKEKNEISNYCSELESKLRLKTKRISNKFSIVGLCKKTSILPIIAYCFRNIDINENKIHMFYRLLKNKLLFDSKFYNRQKKKKQNRLL